MGGPGDVAGLDRAAAVGARHRDRGLENPQQAPRVARGVADELAEGDLVEGHPRAEPPLCVGEGAPGDLAQLRLSEGLEAEDAQP